MREDLCSVKEVIVNTWKTHSSKVVKVITVFMCCHLRDFCILMRALWKGSKALTSKD